MGSAMALLLATLLGRTKPVGGGWRRFRGIIPPFPPPAVVGGGWWWRLSLAAVEGNNWRWVNGGRYRLVVIGVIVAVGGRKWRLEAVCGER